MLISLCLTSTKTDKKFAYLERLWYMLVRIAMQVSMTTKHQKSMTMAVHTLEDLLPNDSKQVRKRVRDTDHSISILKICLQLSKIELSKIGKSGRYPSLFSPDTDEEFSDDSSSDLEDHTHAPLLHISVCYYSPTPLLSNSMLPLHYRRW